MPENLGTDGDKVGVNEASVASASTTNLGTANYVRQQVTGTTTITSFGSSANRLRILRFAGALTITHNGTSLILPSGANILTVAGDIGIFASDASGNWRCLNYFRSAGKPLEVFAVALSDETTSITTGTAKVTMHWPYPFNVEEVYTGVTGASSSGIVRVDVNKAGVSIFTTRPTIGASQETSLTGSGSVAAVLTSTPYAFAKADKITFDIDDAGTSCEGLKCYIVGRQPF